MRPSHPLVIALIVAVLVGGSVVIWHPSYVMTAYAADFARINYQGGFPPSFQRYIDFRYTLGLLFAGATLGAVYFGLVVKTLERWFIAAGFLVPVVLNYVNVLAFFLLPAWILGFMIRAVLLYQRRNWGLFRAYCFCLLFNGLALPLLYIHMGKVLDITL